MFAFALLCGYLAACFCIAALAIRFAPGSITAQQIEHRLWLFSVLPLLLAIDIVVLVGEAALLIIYGAMTCFDRLSGRERRRKKLKLYGYFSYGYAPPARKRESRKSLGRSHRYRHRRRA